MSLHRVRWRMGWAQWAELFGYLGERGHGQQRVLSDGVVSEVGWSVQRFHRAHLPFRTTEETPRVTGPHPHHPPVNTEHSEGRTGETR